VDYDPELVSYKKLLEIFWDSHNPSLPPWSRQYMAAIFYHNEEQRNSAEQSKIQLASITKGEIITKILPFTRFYLAEDYHQKFSLQRHPELMREYSAKFPSTKDLISSTAVTRVNAYLGGYGECSQLQADIQHFGLSVKGSKKLLRVVCDQNIQPSCPVRN
jgi:peptide-methionine (S)-S-oxide reductase